MSHLSQNFFFFVYKVVKSQWIPILWSLILIGGRTVVLPVILTCPDGCYFLGVNLIIELSQPNLS